VIVRGREQAHVAKGVEGDGVIRCTVANSGSIASDASIIDIVVGLSTDEDTIPGKNDVTGDVGSLLKCQSK
jgi:hypothetical protein